MAEKTTIVLEDTDNAIVFKADGSFEIVLADDDTPEEDRKMNAGDWLTCATISKYICNTKRTEKDINELKMEV